MNAGPRPLLDALKPTPGLIRWLGVRLGVVLLFSLPALFAGLAGVGDGVARRPYYTAEPGKLPLVQLVRLMRDLPGGAGAALMIGVLFAILFDQLLTGGAALFFDPARPPAERGKVSRAVLRDGLVHLWAFLRVIGLSLLLWAIGIGLIRYVFKKLDVMGYQSGWTGNTLVLRLPLLSALLMLLWVASVGAWAFWCRVMTAADGRVRVRRTGLLVFRVFARHPLRSWGAFTALSLGATLLSGAALVAWRLAEPRGGARLLGWIALWLLTLVVQSFVWLWLVRAARLLYASEGLADVRGRPDDPYRLWSRLWSKMPWKRKAGAPSPEEPKAAQDPEPEPRPEPRGDDITA